MAERTAKAAPWPKNESGLDEPQEQALQIEFACSAKLPSILLLSCLCLFPPMPLALFESCKPPDSLLRLTKQAKGRSPLMGTALFKRSDAILPSPSHPLICCLMRSDRYSQAVHSPSRHVQAGLGLASCLVGPGVEREIALNVNPVSPMFSQIVIRRVKMFSSNSIRPLKSLWCILTLAENVNLILKFGEFRTLVNPK